MRDVDRLDEFEVAYTTALYRHATMRSSEALAHLETLEASFDAWLRETNRTLGREGPIGLVAELHWWLDAIARERAERLKARR